MNKTFGTNWITPSEATAYTGLSKTFLYRNRSGLNGDVIPYAKAGKRILYNIADLDAYLKASGGYRKSNAAAQDSAQTGD